MKNKRTLASASLFFLIIAGFALLLASCKTSPRTVEGRMIIADLDPIETAVITAQFENFMGTAINPAQVTVSFAPRTDEALLEFRMNGNVYMLYLHREARALIREAVVRYNEDFDARRLDSGMNKRRSDRVYGEVEDNYMRWGLGSLAMNGEAYPKIAVGYRFEHGSPYFTITVYSAENPRYKSGDSNIEQSVTYHIYMNKAQSLALAQELDEGVLMRALDTVTIPVFEPDMYEPDAYVFQEEGRADIYGEETGNITAEEAEEMAQEDAAAEDEAEETYAF